MTRIKKLGVAVRELGLDAVIIGQESRINRRYLCGFRSSGGTLIVAATGESWFITDGRYAELAAERAAQQGYHLQLAETTAEYDGIAAEIVRKAGFTTLGYEAHLVSDARAQSLRELMPCEMCPVSNLVEPIREQKTSEEVQMIEKAQRIAEKAFDHVLNYIRPGATEKEIACELTVAMYRGGAEDLAFKVFCLSGPNASRPHGVTGDRPVQAGDFVMLDFGAVWEGYYSDMTRTVAVGHVTDEMHEIYHAVLKAQAAGIAAACPGVTAGSVDKAARDVLTAAGYGKEFAHLFGHGLGLSVAEAPFADVGVSHILPEGAVLTAEPGIYLPGRTGVRIEDMIWLSPEGTVNLTRTPKDLLIL